MSAFAESGAEGAEAGAAENKRPKSGLPVDPRRLIAAVLKSWRVVLISGVLLGALAFAGAFLKFKTKHEATGHLMKQETVATVRASELGDPFRPRQISVPTLVGLARSPSIAQRVSAVTQVPARNIVDNMVIKLERNTDLINLHFTTTRSPQALDDLTHFHPANWIKAAGRLVKNQQIGIVDERLGESDTLLHSLGIRFNGPLPGVIEFDEFQRLINPAVRLGPGNSEKSRVKAEQFLGGEELVVVGQFRQVADALTGDWLAHARAEEEGVPARGVGKAQQHVHRGGFARAVRTEKTEHLALLHREVQIAHRLLHAPACFGAAIGDAEVFDFEDYIYVAHLSCPEGAQAGVIAENV